jgi:hypothetical protein
MHFGGVLVSGNLRSRSASPTKTHFSFTGNIDFRVLPMMLLLLLAKIPIQSCRWNVTAAVVVWDAWYLHRLIIYRCGITQGNPFCNHGTLQTQVTHHLCH